VLYWKCFQCIMVVLLLHKGSFRLPRWKSSNRQHLQSNPPIRLLFLTIVMWHLSFNFLIRFFFSKGQVKQLCNFKNSFTYPQCIVGNMLRVPGLVFYPSRNKKKKKEWEKWDSLWPFTSFLQLLIINMLDNLQTNNLASWTQMSVQMSEAPKNGESLGTKRRGY